MKNIVVGQKVYVRLWRTGELVEATVESVGRLYFTLSGRPNEKYNLKTLREVSRSGYYAGDYRVYLSEQDYSDEKLHQVLSDEIKRLLGGFGRLNYSLDQLRKIADIIGIKTDK